MNPIFLFLIIFPFFSESLINEKVLICGVCRDVSNQLPSTIKIIEGLGSKFKSYKVIVYENNSTDSTKDILKNWQLKNKKVIALSENIDEKILKQTIVNYKNGAFFKPEEIARARNIVLDRAMSAEFKEYSYVIWIDMDFKLAPNLEGINELFNEPTDWDAVFAYGIDPPGTYWDWYAFRDKNEPLGSETLGNTWWYLPKTFKLNRSDPWHPVYSAFGGFGIYKKKSIEGCRYSATVTKDLVDLTKRILLETDNKNEHIKVYNQLLSKTKTYAYIDSPKVGLEPILDPHTGILLTKESDAPVFRMSSFAYNYPSVCEHVTFHASMILRGHGKLFINPRIVFHYGS